MKVTRVYSQIYSYSVQVDQPANDSIKTFFKSGLSDLKNKTIRGITVSNCFIGTPGQTDQIYITLLDRNNNTLLYNYPVVDLLDLTGGNSSNINKTRLRLFNLTGLELQNSYFFIVNVTGPIQGKIFDLNFYFED